jgi:SAM-dependent methyltransferase
MILHDLPTSGASAGAHSPAARPVTPDAHAAWPQLWREASARYRGAGRFAYHFARGKLRRDPVFRSLLMSGHIAPGARVLDIGCGQGLLASLLAACDSAWARGQWPARWPPAPTRTHYAGLELMARDVARAAVALSGLPRQPQVRCGDLRSTAFAPCDVAVILDVLHYVAVHDQDDVLARVHEALAPGGRLLLRVGDAASGWRHVVTRTVDHVVTLGRGHHAAPSTSRTLQQWVAALQDRGFAVRVMPMHEGTPFANMLLICDKAAAPAGLAP